MSVVFPPGNFGGGGIDSNSQNEKIKESIARGRMQARDPPWLWNPEQTSPELQNRSISDPTKRTDVFQKIKVLIYDWCPLFPLNHGYHVIFLSVDKARLRGIV